MMTLAERLRQARQRKVWTQMQLAVAAETSLVTISRLEKGGEGIGQSNPRPSTIQRLAEVLDVSPQWLMFGDDDKDTTPVRDQSRTGAQEPHW